MKAIKLMLFCVLMAILTLGCLSCQETSSDGGAPTHTQNIPTVAQHLGRSALVGNELYLKPLGGSSNYHCGIFVCDPDAESFEPYYPCYVPSCRHNGPECVALAEYNLFNLRLTACGDSGEPTVVMCSTNGDVYISKPISNEKRKPSGSDYSAGPKTNLFIYGDHLYYSQKVGSTYIQYRVSLDDGVTERVFEQDNIIIKTILNNKYYGVIYKSEIQVATPLTNDDVTYFRSDMDYQNVETLPEMMWFFYTPEEKFIIRATAILDADEQSIYVLQDHKIWAFSDADIYAEPKMVFDMEVFNLGKWQESQSSSWYRDGMLHFIWNYTHSSRVLLDQYGSGQVSRGWYKTSHLYSINIMTGEYEVTDIATDTAQFRDIFFIDDKYLYGEGVYAHYDGRSDYSVLMRLNLDTLECEPKLCEEFLAYTPETTVD